MERIYGGARGGGKNTFNKEYMKRTFNPDHKYGSYRHVSTKEYLEKTREILLEEAHFVVPEEYNDHISIIVE